MRKNADKVSSRQELLTKKLLDEIIYTNAAGYIRIVDNGNEDVGLNPFDDTRIHPKYYITEDWGNLICKEAIDPDADDPNDVRRQWQKVDHEKTIPGQEIVYKSTLSGNEMARKVMENAAMRNKKEVSVVFPNRIQRGRS